MRVSDGLLAGCAVVLVSVIALIGFAMIAYAGGLNPVDTPARRAAMNLVMLMLVAVVGFDLALATGVIGRWRNAELAAGVCLIVAGVCFVAAVILSA